MKIKLILLGTALVIVGALIGFQMTMVSMSTCVTSFEPMKGTQVIVPIICTSGIALVLYGFIDTGRSDSEKKEIVQKEEKGVQ
jgi:protein-S-isoprenylcysteine O-methyltransferase Ste14